MDGNSCTQAGFYRTGNAGAIWLGKKCAPRAGEGLSTIISFQVMARHTQTALLVDLMARRSSYGVGLTKVDTYAGARP